MITKTLLYWQHDLRQNIYWGIDAKTKIKTRTALIKDVLHVETDLMIVTDIMNCRYVLYENYKKVIVNSNKKGNPL